jgi:hypothetical protein
VIAVEPGTYRFLLRGRPARVCAPRDYRPGRTYHAGVEGRRTVVRVRVLETRAGDNGTWELTIRIALPDTARYLAADPGANRDDYTSNPIRAAREVDGGPIEAILHRCPDTRYSLA